MWRRQSHKILGFRLDFHGEQSVLAFRPEGAIDAAIADPAVNAYLKEIRQRLDDAARIAKAAEVWC